MNGREYSIGQHVSFIDDDGNKVEGIVSEIFQEYLYLGLMVELDSGGKYFAKLSRRTPACQIDELNAPDGCKD